MVDSESIRERVVDGRNRLRAGLLNAEFRLQTLKSADEQSAQRNEGAKNCRTGDEDEEAEKEKELM